MPKKKSRSSSETHSRTSAAVRFAIAFTVGFYIIAIVRWIFVLGAPEGSFTMMMSFSAGYFVASLFVTLSVAIVLDVLRINGNPLNRLWIAIVLGLMCRFLWQVTDEASNWPLGNGECESWWTYFAVMSTFLLLQSIWVRFLHTLKDDKMAG